MALLPERSVALVSHSTCQLGLIDLSNFVPTVTDRFDPITPSSSECDSSYTEGVQQSIESAKFTSVNQILELSPGGGEYIIVDKGAKNIRLIDWCSGVVKNLASR